MYIAHVDKDQTGSQWDSNIDHYLQNTKHQLQCNTRSRPLSYCCREQRWVLTWDALIRKYSKCTLAQQYHICDLYTCLQTLLLPVMQGVGTFNRVIILGTRLVLNIRTYMPPPPLYIKCQCFCTYTCPFHAAGTYACLTLIAAVEFVLTSSVIVFLYMLQ